LSDEAFEVIELDLRLSDALELNRAGPFRVFDPLAPFVEDAIDDVKLLLCDGGGDRLAPTDGWPRHLKPMHAVRVCDADTGRVRTVGIRDSPSVRAAGRRRRRSGDRSRGNRSAGMSRWAQACRVPT
jgi:hypothetical protein